MPQRQMNSVFMDSSALFAAILSPTGAARRLIVLGLSDRIRLVISGDVLIETRRNLVHKAPELEPLLDRLLDEIDFEITASPPKEDIRAAEEYVAAKDAFIIAAAVIAAVDYLVTFDRKHLIDPPEVSARSGLHIGTPGDVLNEIQSSFG